MLKNPGYKETFGSVIGYENILLQNAHYAKKCYHLGYYI